MNNFEKKWLKCVCQARTVKFSHQEAPSGFAEQVIWRCKPTFEISVQDLWFRASIKALAAMTSLLAISIYLHLRISNTSESIRPCLENTVAQILMSL